MTTSETIAEHEVKISHLEDNIESLWSKYDRIIWLLIMVLTSSVATLLKITFFNG